MTDSFREDPEWQRYANHLITEVVPRLDNSAMCVNILPRKPEDADDIQYCTELGMMILMDKPIIIIVRPGTQVPDKVIRVADEIVEADIGAPDFEPRLMAAMDRVAEKFGIDRD